MIPNTILSTFGIKDDIFLTQPTAIENEENITVFATLEPLSGSEKICPHCKSKNIVVKDKRIVKITLIPFVGQTKPILLLLEKRRYVCKSCLKTFTQDTSLVNKGKRLSNEIYWAVFAECKKIISYTQIAENLKIPTPTVLSIFDEMPFDPKIELPSALCIDEKAFKTDHGKYVCVISDAISGKIIDIIESRKKDYLIRYFSRFSKDERKKVKYFISDMYEVYRDIKNMFFEFAIHIVDKFHVSKIFTEKIQLYRKSYMKTLELTSKEYKFLKKFWKLF